MTQTVSKFGLNPTELRTLVANEHTREKDNGTVVFYREIHLLKGIYVKKDATKEEVEKFFYTKGLNIAIKKI